MKKLFALSLCVIGTSFSEAQFLEKLADKAVNAAERTVERRVEREAEKKTNEAIDGVLDGNKKETNTKNNPRNKENNSSTSTKGKEVNVTKESDFVPGNSLVFSDDFQKDAKGDFPAKWNTNGSGQVVTIDNTKWLALNHNSAAHPELTKALPENSTISFDLLLVSKKGETTPTIQFGLTKSKNILKEKTEQGRFYIQLRKYADKNSKTLEYGLNQTPIGNKSDFPLNNYVNEILHVDIAINGTRIRVYLDGEKIIDLPKALTPELRNNFFITNSMVIPATQTPLYISNLRIASADVDARSSVAKDLFEKGSASTSDILFDTGKSTIKSSSHPILDELGTSIKNSKSTIVIIGHTDSDGSEDANQKLSEQRAESVKNYLITKFKIPSNQILTSGKGESEPVSNNNTEDGKKQNRRVEFKKL
ncbi:OmpA family protein [Moheibacter stercoris]|uniref:Outer membrane protein OmpA-like peptidoglycan-associated protein n=1 Tax=Moheibacter stercoris TaxID=1628251 RepID=A0ABV2LU26_9FLAO